MHHPRLNRPLDTIFPPGKTEAIRLPNPIVPISEVQSRESRGLPPVELILRDESDARTLFQRLYGVNATNCRTLVGAGPNAEPKSVASILEDARKFAEKEYNRATAGKKGAEVLTMRFSRKAAAEKYLLKNFGINDEQGKLSLPPELSDALALKYDRKVPANLEARRATVEMFGEKAGLNPENLPVILEQIEGYSGAKNKLLIDDYRAFALGAGVCATGIEVGAGRPRIKGAITNPLKKSSYSALSAKGVRVDEK